MTLAAAAYAIFFWWFSTGAILYVVSRADGRGPDGYLSDKGLIPMPDPERQQFQSDVKALTPLTSPAPERMSSDASARAASGRGSVSASMSVTKPC